MPVPDTTTFSLQDVINEIAGSQTSLIECFAEANSTGFDLAYSGAKDRLSNFRNYDHTGGNPPPPSNTTYYQLTGCTAPNAWTSIVPTSGTGQRYIHPTGGLTYYTYNGTSISQGTPPSGFIGSIQILVGESGCP